MRAGRKPCGARDALLRPALYLAQDGKPEDLLSGDLRLPDERPRLGKSCGHAHRAGIPPGRERRGSRTGPLQHLLHPRQGGAEGLPPPGRFPQARSARARSSACWAAWRSRKARRFSSARRTSRWCAVRRHIATCRRCWCNWKQGSALPGSTTARPPKPSRPSSPPAATRTAATSPSPRAATSSAPSAWFPTRAGASAAGPRTPSSPKPARWPAPATPRSSFSARTSTRTTIHLSKKTFSELLAAVGELAGLKRVRFTTSHPIDFTRDIVDAIDAVPALCDHVHLPVQSGSTRVLDAMHREYTREDYLATHRLDQGGAARDLHHYGHHRRLPRRDRGRVRRDAQPARRGRLRRHFCLQVLAAAQYSRADHGGQHPGRGEIAPPRGPPGASKGDTEAPKRTAFRTDT